MVSRLRRHVALLASVFLLTLFLLYRMAPTLHTSSISPSVRSRKSAVLSERAKSDPSLRAVAPTVTYASPMAGSNATPAPSPTAAPRTAVVYPSPMASTSSSISSVSPSASSGGTVRPVGKIRVKSSKQHLPSPWDIGSVQVLPSSGTPSSSAAASSTTAAAAAAQSICPSVPLFGQPLMPAVSSLMQQTRARTDRILFMVVTGTATFDRAVTVYGSWGRFINHVLFITDQLVTDTFAYPLSHVGPAQRSAAVTSSPKPSQHIDIGSHGTDRPAVHKQSYTWRREDESSGTGIIHSALPQVAFPQTAGGYAPSQYKWMHGLMHIADCYFTNADSKSVARPASAHRFDWLLVCDDDSYVNPHFLAQYIDSAIASGTLSPDRPHYIGETMKQHNSPAPFLAGGACYLLSRAAVLALRTVLPACYLGSSAKRGAMFSDIRIGSCMRDLGINTTDQPQFFHYFPAHYEAMLRDYMDPAQSSGRARRIKPKHVPANPISFHHVKDEMFNFIRRYMNVE